MKIEIDDNTAFVSTSFATCTAIVLIFLFISGCEKESQKVRSEADKVRFEAGIYIPNRGEMIDK